MAEIASLRKLQIHLAKKSFHIFYVGTCGTVIRTSKSLIYSQRIKTVTLQRFLTIKRKWSQSLTKFCKLLHPYCFIYRGIPNNILLLSADRLVSCCFIMSRLKKGMIPGVNIRGKASPAGINRAGGSRGWWCSETLSRDFRGHSPLSKLLGSKEHQDWLKIDLNMGKIITAQDYKCTKN